MPMNGDGASSFICERTSEYYISHSFIQAALRSSCTPSSFFYWASREGANQSKHRNADLSLKIAAVYARRPKLYRDDLRIHIKINSELTAFANAAATRGLPCFAAAPIAHSLDELHRAPCAWINLIGASAGLDTLSIAPDQKPFPFGWRTTEDIVKLLDLESSMPWEYWIQTINELRPYLGTHPATIFRGPQYKPFYVALVQN